MGSGGWFKNIIRLRKVKYNKQKKLKGSSAPEVSNGVQLEPNSQKESSKFGNGTSNGNNVVLGLPIDEERAATRIQNAFRAYMARKTMHNLKGMVRLQKLSQVHLVSKRQASTTLSYLHSWSRIQAEIRARRISMVIQGRIRQKKLENQLKLEEKLHDLEVEWSGGSETLEEVLARIHMREEAAVKRERTMAYAFSHQWRANSNSNFGAGNYELGNANWGWSWTERWIAARPWEGRAIVHSSPKKVESLKEKKNAKNMKSPSIKTPVLIKSISPNGKGITKGRKLSYGNGRAEEANAKREPMVS